MYKIKRINITNFKFFFGTTSLDFDRKNILIYGENGSGKSSIYWALHCFLHSTLKSDLDGVRKYFKHITEHDESIKNRYASQNNPSSIEVILSHQEKNLYADIITKISNTTVNTKTFDDVKLMTMSSDLINYKVIYNMYPATNRSSIKLFPYFVDNLLEFIDFKQGLVTIYGQDLSKCSLDWWRYIKNGMKPYTTMNNPLYHDFQGHVRSFNENMRESLQLITDRANNLLINDFNENFEIELRYKHATYNEFNEHNKGRNRITLPPEIELIVKLPYLSGKSSIVERPHSYLNEARLSSIALAIRLAILEERFSSHAPRVLVLDDLLLSLDLGNREVVLKLLFDKYINRYQLIILTHDRVFFDSVLNHLPKDELKENWKCFEMYETKDGDKKVPSIVEYKTSLAKAIKYFNGDKCDIDYNACGNNQRQAIEEIFKNQFKTYCLRDNDNNKIETSQMMISECIEKAKQLYPIIGFDTVILDELKICTKQSLNPSSHHNPKSNFYKRELQRTFEIISILNKHDIRVFIPVDSELKFKVSCEDGSEHDYKLKVLDDILVYKQSAGDYYFVNSDKYDFQMIEYNGKIIDYKIKSNTLADMYNDTCNHIDKTSKATRVEDMYYVFEFEGLNLMDLLNGINS